jgi:hypothetical protein
MRGLEIGNERWIDADKPIDILHDPGRALRQVVEQKDVDLLTRE